MFASVRRHRPLVYLLIAAQLLLSVPVVNALAAMSSASVAAMPCAGDMPEQDHCPCCPEGVTNMATCLAACTASVGAPSLPMFEPAPAESAAPPTHVTAILGAADDPPLKPPPIH